MSEEREFWGIGTPGAWEGDPLLTWYGNVPDRKRFRFYPVFDSKEKAETFVREAYARSEHDIVRFALHNILDSIRKIEPNEIRPDRDVSFNGDVPVKWSELTSDDAPPVT